MLDFINIFRKDETKAKAGKLEGVEVFQSARRQNVVDNYEPLCYKDRRGNVICIIDTANMRKELAFKADKCFAMAMAIAL
jgi:hypothetical protein